MSYRADIACLRGFDEPTRTEMAMQEGQSASGLGAPASSWPDDYPDVEARISWLLESWRVAAGMSQRELASRSMTLGAPWKRSHATISRIETAGPKDAADFVAYEDACGLGYGALRVPAEVVRRSFPRQAAIYRPFEPPRTLAAFSHACAAVRLGRDVRGADWLRFAEQHTMTQFGLPADQMRVHIDRLIDELRRSFGAAYVHRYEALTLLRLDPDYGYLVHDAARDVVTEPGAQLLADVMSALGEKPTPELLTWCAELLPHESWPVVQSAAVAIGTMLEAGGLAAADWRVLIAPLTVACNNAAADEAHLRVLASTLEVLPNDVRESVRVEIHDLASRVRRPAARPLDGQKSDDRYPRDLATRTCELLAEHDPERAERLSALPTVTLCDLIGEAIMDFRAARQVPAVFLLRASPYADALQAALAEAAFTAPRKWISHGVVRALSLLLHEPAPDPRPWLGSSDTVLQGLGLEICAWRAIPVKDEYLFERLRSGDDELARHAMFAAGFARHPSLAAIAQDPEIPPPRRDAATWWIRHPEGAVTM